MVKRVTTSGQRTEPGRGARLVAVFAAFVCLFFTSLLRDTPARTLVWEVPSVGAALAPPSADAAAARVRVVDEAGHPLERAVVRVFSVTEGAVFQYGSISKVWTATVLMQLVDEGLTTLDTPVIEILPDFELADPEVARTVTLRHLLVHTSGIDGDEDALPIRSDARVLTLALKAGEAAIYRFARGRRRGYLVASKGRLEVNGVEIGLGDGAAIRDEIDLHLTALDDAEVLLADTHA